MSICTYTLNGELLATGMPGIKQWLFYGGLEKLLPGENVPELVGQVDSGVRFSKSEILIGREQLDYAINKNYDRRDKTTTGFISEISPNDFLRLTTKSKEHIAEIAEYATKNYGKFDANELKKDSIPVLYVEFKFNDDYSDIIGFEIKNHEGRHRASLLSNANINKMPVILRFDTDWKKGNIEKYPNTKIFGQKDIADNESATLLSKPIELMPENLDSILFSKTTPQKSGSTVAQVKSWLPKQVTALMNAGKLKVVQSVGDLPEFLIGNKLLFSFKPEIIDYNDDKSSILVDTGKGEKWFNTDDLGIKREWVGINANSDDLPELLKTVGRRKKQQDIEYENLGYELDKQGNAIIYHATSKQNAEKILKSGKFTAGSFFEGRAEETLNHVRGRVNNPVILKIKVKKELLSTAAAGAEIYSDNEIPFTLFDVNKPYFFESEIDAFFSSNGQIEALYDPKTDTIYMVADMLTKESTPYILAHELTHRAESTDPLIQRALNRLESSIQTAFDNAAKGIGSANDLAAYQRVIEAQTAKKDQLSEFIAYKVTEFLSNPANTAPTIVNAIKGFISSIRVFLIRNGLDMGFIKSLNERDLLAMSKYGARVNELQGNTQDDMVALASKSGYEGNDKGEAFEWLRAVDKGLDMSKEARMARAKKMGFDVETIYYHASQENWFEKSNAKFMPHWSHGMIYFATSEAGAKKGSGKGRNKFVGEFFLRKGKSKNTPDKPIFWADAEDNKGLKNSSFDSMYIKDESGVAIAINNQANVRSIYAAFDPDFADSPNLLASHTTADIKESTAPRLAPNGKPSNLNAKQYEQVRTKEFKAWFGNWENDPENASKVVDENGEPQVNYHGTDSDFNEFDISVPIKNGRGEGVGFYFAPDKKLAKKFTKTKTIKAVFLNVRNNWRGFDSLNQDDQKIYLATKSDKEAYEKLKIDAIQHGGTWIIFNPNQIKSATGNIGSFGTNSNDIRFSRSFEDEANNWLSDTLKKAPTNEFIYNFQNKLIDLKEQIKKVGIEQDNPYRAEELFHQRAASRIDGFNKEVLGDIIKKVNDAGLNREQFNKAIHAINAKSLNAAMALKTPSATTEEKKSLSGLTNDEADVILNVLTPAQKIKVTQLNAQLKAINNQIIDMQVDYGSITPAQAQALKTNTPLNRDAAIDQYANVLEKTQENNETAVRLGERQIVLRSLANFIKQKPDPDFAELDKPILIDKERKGIVKKEVDPFWKNRPEVVIYKVDGVDHSIVFNTNDPNNVRLALSIKAMDGVELDKLESTISKGTRWLASVNTQYNLIFGVVNLVRDTQGMMINLASTPLHGQQTSVLKAMPAAFKSILGSMGRMSGVSAADLARYEEFNREGGTTGFSQMFGDMTDRSKFIESELTDLNAGKPRKTWNFIKNGLSDFNTLMENVTRLAVYNTARANGMSKAESASLAKNITVNFNRKGAVTTKVGAYYAFFNAAVQGTARLHETLTDKDGRLSTIGKQIILGGVGLGAALTLLAMAGMGDDDWDKIPEFIKERSLIIPAMNESGYIAIPMPLGYHILPNIGRKAVEILFGSNKKTPQKHLMELAGSAIGAFNPLGGSDVSGMVMPTVLDPALALWRNKDWTGKSIYKEDFNSLKPTPGFTRAKDTATKLSTFATQWINRLTGGTDAKQGLWSPTPDQFDYVIGQVFGGTGREILKAEQAAVAIGSGSELPSHKIPLIGRFYGNVSGGANESGAYHENVIAINEHDAEIKLMKETGRLSEIDSYKEQFPEAKLIGQAKFIEKAITKLVHHKKEMIQRDASSEDIQKQQDKISAKMKVLNDKVIALRH